LKLGLISDCVHTQTPDGKFASENHIYIRQMEALSCHFDEMIICCPFINYEANKNISTYNKSNITFMPLPNVGGDSLKAKLKLLFTIPIWLKAFYHINKKVDIIYQRFPNNLNIPGFFFFYCIRKKVFATYTGTWPAEPNQPITYRFQKWLLKKLFRGPVWVYDERENLGKNIFSGFSPSYTQQEWNEEIEQVAGRVEQLNNQPLASLKIVTVGSLNTNKNQQYILNTCLLLKEASIPFHLTIVGIGPLKEQYEYFVLQKNLQDNVTITGALNYKQLREVYRQNDFVVQAAVSEGFGKVPIEGFFHGLIPVLNITALAPYMTDNGRRGYLFNVIEPQSLFTVLKQIYFTQPAKLLAQKIEEGRIFAKTQTLENWASMYHQKIEEYFG
jgi:glycosyltransferase involved in cell wall biosynthesis